MQRRAIGQSSSRGFSLVEILVVLTIMALATSMIMLNMGARTPTLAAEADRLALHLAAARDLALVRNRAVRVTLDGAGYQTLIERRAGWTAPDMAAAATLWLNDTRLLLPGDVTSQSITFDSIGLSEPASIQLQRLNEAQTIVLDATGAIRRAGAS